ncbi:MAG: hypothetical protein RMJ59_04665 [Candidatus Nitrosocaldus sp.]|nr:hypothetical protein [Candidatus Nitrosocaldus sp.]MDW8275657.1 hypothetical protein [Candidatus Nitrosocaldus sp.]
MEIRCSLNSQIRVGSPTLVRRFMEMIMEHSLQQLNHKIMYVSNTDEADVLIDVNISSGDPSISVIPIFSNRNRHDRIDMCHILLYARIRGVLLPAALSPHSLYMYNNNIVLSCAMCKAVFTIYHFIGLVNLQDMLNLYAGASYYFKKYMNASTRNDERVISLLKIPVTDDGTYELYKVCRSV